MSNAQLRNCGKKRRFLSPGDALSSVSEKGLSVYSCPVCAGFHLTSKVASRKTPPTNKIIEAEKPIFDGSLLARARWIKK